MSYDLPASMFPVTVTVTPIAETASDGLGGPEPTAGEPFAVMANVQRVELAAEGRDGTLFRQGYRLFFRADPGIALGDLLSWTHAGAAAAALADGPAVAQGPGGFGGAYELTAAEVGPAPDA